MKPDPDSNNSGNPKAYIKEKYRRGKLPAASYVGASKTAQDIKDTYGIKYYYKLGVTVNDILGRSRKLPMVSKKITY